MSGVRSSGFRAWGLQKGDSAAPTHAGVTKYLVAVLDFRVGPHNKPSCQDYVPFWGTLNLRGIMPARQTGTVILTTCDMCSNQQDSSLCRAPSGVSFLFEGWKGLVIVITIEHLAGTVFVAGCLRSSSEGWPGLQMRWVAMSETVILGSANPFTVQP